MIENQLIELRDRGPLRVITTTYMGATERRALDELVRRFGAQVRITYEETSTRLHAKAWLFRRHSGSRHRVCGQFEPVLAWRWSTAWSGMCGYPGSPPRNSSASSGPPSIPTGRTPAFTTYDPDADGEQLASALRRAGGSGGGRPQISLSGLEVRPFPHQDQILEALETERRSTAGIATSW